MLEGMEAGLEGQKEPSGQRVLFHSCLLPGHQLAALGPGPPSPGSDQGWLAVVGWSSSQLSHQLKQKGSGYLHHSRSGWHSLPLHWQRQLQPPLLQQNRPLAGGKGERGSQWCVDMQQQLSLGAVPAPSL